jgi:hypothetical protein
MSACGCCSRREPRSGRTCEPCLWRLRGYLVEIPDLYARLPLLKGKGAEGPMVSGSRERQVPVHLDSLDLTLAPRLAAVSDPYGDQTGHSSVTTILDAWVAEWIEHRGQRETRPLPMVYPLSSWLLARLRDACQEGYPGMDAFFIELGQLVVVMSSIIGELPKAADVSIKIGVPCKSCDMMTLYQANGSEWVECGACPVVLSEHEYRDWARSLIELGDAA